MKRSPVAILRHELDNALGHRDADSAAKAAYLKGLWKDGVAAGVVAFIDGVQKGDPPDTKCAVICSVADKTIVRCALTKQRAINLSRALIEAVSG